MLEELKNNDVNNYKRQNGSRQENFLQKNSSNNQQFFELSDESLMKQKPNTEKLPVEKRPKIGDTPKFKEN